MSLNTLVALHLDKKNLNKNKTNYKKYLQLKTKIKIKKKTKRCTNVSLLKLSIVSDNGAKSLMTS